jgi:hypothetical protein
LDQEVVGKPVSGNITSCKDKMGGGLQLEEITPSLEKKSEKRGGENKTTS